MANILEMAKNIHPTHTLSEEELRARYIEIYPNIKRDIEFFIEVYPETSAPLFISGQIGSGKSTLLKSLVFNNAKMHYLDVSDLSIFNPNDSIDVTLLIVYKIFQLTNSQGDLSSIEELITKNRVDDIFFGVDNNDIINTIIEFKNKNTIKSKAIVIDGLDRFLELSNLKTITNVLLDLASIWKVLEQKLIFVTPLFFTQSSQALAEYAKVYEADTLDQTHLTIPIPDPINTIFWKEFIAVRAQMDELKLSDQQINDLVGLSGGVLRGTLVILRHLLNLMYRNGDVVVKDTHIIQLSKDVQNSLSKLMPSPLSKDWEALEYINKYKPSTIPNNAIHLFTKDIPLALFTQRDGKVMCILHPLVELSDIPF
ncbi:hypothetical protein [Sulfuricurvum sp.]|uniref:hypothetical protein n=1 Tax=Sulfuricurvum sp. TaxID=2025608 RepID=UPI0026350456|nr:hypothetical protein [Sulfuricurvum sp.]MDD2780629.1 hypothetical protein [Sulfuricurvum sp.]